MEAAKEKLRSLISNELFRNFLNAPSRRHIDYHLDLGSLHLVSDEDAEWFIRTYESGILTEVDGDFLAPRSSDEERIFSHGLLSETRQRLVTKARNECSLGHRTGRPSTNLPS